MGSTSLHFAWARVPLEFIHGVDRDMRHGAALGLRDLGTILKTDVERSDVVPCGEEV